MAAEVACTHPLVDHAIVVGANTTLELDGSTPRGSGIFECSYVPRILFEYPPSRPLDAKVAVAAFCLPSALRLARVRRPPHFACFVLTLSDGSRMYGHCMTIHELVGPATEVVLPPREVPAGWRECADGALRYVLEGTGSVCADGDEPVAVAVNTLVRVDGATTLRWVPDDELVLLTPEYKGPNLLPFAAGFLVLMIGLIAVAGGG